MTEATPQTVRVGLAVWIIHDNKVLMNCRVKTLGKGTWASPGGHLEMQETWEECAKREALEEAGLAITDVECFAVTNDIMESGKHYVTIHMQSRSHTPNFTNKEPEKYQDFNWFSWDNLPTPLFPSTVNLLTENKKPTYLN